MKLLLVVLVLLNLYVSSQCLYLVDLNKYSNFNNNDNLNKIENELIDAIDSLDRIDLNENDLISLLGNENLVKNNKKYDNHDTDLNNENSNEDADERKVNKRSFHLKNAEFCRHVKCENIHSNGQVSKTWRQAQLTACCPEYRRKYHNTNKKNQ